MNEETKDSDKDSEAEHKENEDTEIQATVSMYFTNNFYTRINNASKKWGGTTENQKRDISVKSTGTGPRRHGGAVFEDPGG